MTDRRFIKPVGELVVRDPLVDGNPPLPPHGKGVAWDAYWQRRLDQGDVEETTAEAVEAGEKVAAKALAKAEEGEAGKRRGAAEGETK